MNVYIRTAAREDILRQYFYYMVEKDAARAAERFLEAVQSAIEMLCQMPGAGAPKILENRALTGFLFVADSRLSGNAYLLRAVRG